MSTREARLGPLTPSLGVASALDEAGPRGVTPEPRATELVDEASVNEALVDEAEAVALADPVGLALASLANAAYNVQLYLELSLSRRFRDGSLGWLVRITDAYVDQDAGIGSDASAKSTVTDWSLAGRSVELRTFADGEILAVNGAEHIDGPDRLGGLADLLWPLLSPRPPALDAGDEGRATANWPQTVASDRGWRHSLGASWKNLGLDPRRGAWHLSWAGDTAATGRDLALSPPVGARASGRFEGDLWLLDVDRLPVPQRVQESRARLARDVEIEYPGAQGGPVRVLQHQDVQAHLRRVDPDSDPSLYPDPEPTADGVVQPADAGDLP